jgi:hypothetical protein
MCELPPSQIKFVAKKTIVLWGHDDLLGTSVEFLLNTRKQVLDLIRVTDEQGMDGLIQAVNTIQPDVVVLCDQLCSVNDVLPVQLMQDQQWIKLVIINPENNSVEVFSKQKLLIQEDTDLLSIVEGCPRLPCPSENL